MSFTFNIFCHSTIVNQFGPKSGKSYKRVYCITYAQEFTLTVHIKYKRT